MPFYTKVIREAGLRTDAKSVRGVQSRAMDAVRALARQEAAVLMQHGLRDKDFAWRQAIDSSIATEINFGIARRKQDVSRGSCYRQTPLAWGALPAHGGHSVGSSSSSAHVPDSAQDSNPVEELPG